MGDANHTTRRSGHLAARAPAALLLAVALLAVPFAPARAEGGFEHHVRGALRVNQSRLPLYAELSGGASEAVSRRLVSLERLSLPTAIVLDRLARRFQRRGVPLLEDEFVPMETAAPFGAHLYAPAEPLALFVRTDGGALADRLKAAWKRGGYSGLEQAADAEAAALAAAPTFHHMTKHLLESVARVARLAPLHAARARARGLGSPLFLSGLLVRSHLLMLGQAARLDELAAPVQARGIPILRDDLPPLVGVPTSYER